MLVGSRIVPARTFAVLAAAAGLLLAGCGVLPSAGPTVSQLLDQQSRDGKPRFAIVSVDQRVAAAVLAAPHPSFRSRFPQRATPPEPRIGVGDSVVVSIWEGASGGLFTSAVADQVAPGSHSIVLPEQTVGRDGAISVPFAGRVPAAHRLPVEVQHTIEQRLSGKAIEPQAIVSVTKSVTNTATVTGEVVKGERVPLSLKGDRLLDVVAAAGGARTPVYETSIRLSRDGATATMPMEALVADPAENIYARPGDVLTVVRVPRTYTVLGAAGRNSEIDFPAGSVTLIEAVARGGGLQDQRSDPAGVFLFRWEEPAIAAALGVKPGESSADGRVGIVYRLDLSDARAYLAAARFPIKDKDILYIANSSATEVEKFLQLINGLIAPAVTGAVVRNAVQ
jgi:polysaccharide biosynthesis/export protein